MVAIQVGGHHVELGEVHHNCVGVGRRIPTTSIETFSSIVMHFGVVIYHKKRFSGMKILFCKLGIETPIGSFLVHKVACNGPVDVYQRAGWHITLERYLRRDL